MIVGALVDQSCTHRAAGTRSRAWLLLGLAACLAGTMARSDEPTPAPTPAEKAGTRRALILCGLPGDDDRRTLDAGAVAKMAEGLTQRCGFPAAEVWVRFGAEAAGGESFGPTTSRGPADRAGIEADVAELRSRIAPEDALWVIVLGHGHFDGRHSHLNLPGPDLDERDFAKLFAGITAREQVFWVTTSVSGYFVKPLAAPGRVVIAATEADREVNETLFPLALADVLAAPPPEADRDKDGALSLFELYLAVVTDVLTRYSEAENVPTEHARIDDNGDGHGSESHQNFLPEELGGPKRKDTDPEPKLGPKDDGLRAASIRVDRPVDQAEPSPAALKLPGSPP